MAHRVRTHRWHRGQLRIHDELFETFELADLFARTRFGAESVKIYNDDNFVVKNIVSGQVSWDYASGYDYPQSYS